MITASSCNSDEPAKSTPLHTPRTVLLYMVAQNNLSSNATSDLQEIRTAVIAGDLADSRLIIYHDSYSAAPALKEYDRQGNLITLTDYDDETLSVSSERMLQVISDMKSIAPANRYGLILWGHGTGYVQDGIEDTVNKSETEISPLSYGGETQPDRKNYWMNTTTLARTLEGEGFDWIYFDCCFMAGVEVAYELRHATGHIVASATELPSDGMPYDKALRHIMPEESHLDDAARATFDHYNSLTGMYRTCTISVINTAAMDDLAHAMQAIYSASGSSMPDGYIPQAFQTPDDHRLYGWSYYDLAHYAKALAGENREHVDLAMKAIGAAVENAYNTPMLWNQLMLSNHCGLSTLIIESPDDPQLDRFGYRGLQWWTDVIEPALTTH